MIMWFLILIIIALFIVLEVPRCIEYNKRKKEICPGALFHVCTNYWASNDNPYVEPKYIDIEIISSKKNKNGTLYVQYKLGDIDVFNVDTFDNLFERYLKYDNKVVEPKNINYGFDSTRKVE